MVQGQTSQIRIGGDASPSPVAKHPFNSNQACSHVAVALLEALQYEPSQASAVIPHAIRRELTGADSPAARQWAEEIERNFK